MHCAGGGNANGNQTATSTLSRKTRRAQVLTESRPKSRARDARDETGKTPFGPIRQEGYEPTTSHCHRTIRSARSRREDASRTEAASKTLEPVSRHKAGRRESPVQANSEQGLWDPVGLE